MFDHKYLAHHQLPQLLGGTPFTATPPSQSFANALARSSPNIPQKLRKDIAREQDVIIEAVTSYLQGGGKWPRNTPSILPKEGSEEALARYMMAKRWQTKFDLLTAAFLHASSAQVSREAHAALQKGFVRTYGTGQF